MKKILLGERGNALWFVLIAVVLIAALTIMLTRSNSNTNNSGDSEQLRLQATQLMRYGQSIAIGIQQLLSKGCSENQISFENDFDLNYSNTNSPADKSCHVFDSKGAGLTFKDFADLSPNVLLSAGHIVFTGHLVIEGNGENNKSEIGMYVSISETLCAFINKELNVSNDPSEYNSSTIEDWGYHYIGAPGQRFSIPNDGAPAATDKEAGCFYDQNAQPVYFQVLLAR